MNEFVVAISSANLITLLGAGFTIYGRLVKVETKVSHIEEQITNDRRKQDRGY